MKIDRDGVPFIVGASAPAGLALALGRRRAALLLAVLPAAIGAFFRDPDRRPDVAGVPASDDVIVAPADGRVMHVGVPQQDVAPPGDWQQISIFLSLWDVHINRTPVGGVVESVTHRPGRYRAAFKAESAHENERSEIVVRSSVGGRERILIFRQIVGVAARRVVTRVRPGDRLVAGERIGLMKFGSRMDVFVPLDVTIEVAVGDRTVAGESILGRWPS